MTDAHTEKEKATNTKKIKRNIMYKKDSEETSLKEKEKETYRDFVHKGKQMLQQASKGIVQTGDNIEDEEENLM